MSKNNDESRADDDVFRTEYEDDSSTVGPSGSDVDAWAERERRRREAWLAGPSEDEKIEWARRHRRSRGPGSSSYDDEPYRGSSSGCGPSFYDPTRDPVVRRLQRDTDLATKGILNYCFNAPYIFMSQLIRAGRSLEEDPYFRSMPGRVPFYDD